MDEQTRLNRAIELLSRWIVKVELSNAIDYYDINRVSENLAKRLLNAVYGLSLKDLNEEQRNFPAVDLGDDDAKIAYQITSTVDEDKVRTTLEKFVRHGLGARFTNGIRFLSLSNKDVRSSKRCNAAYPTFDLENHVITPERLIQRIKVCYQSDQASFAKILTVLEQSIPAAPPISKPATAPAPSTLPPRRHLVGREAELSNLSHALGAGDRIAPPHGRASLFGLAGVGKTALALEYAHRHLEDYPSGTWWVRGDVGPIEAMMLLASDLRRIGPPGARAIIAREPFDSPPQQLARATQLALQNLSEPALLILDNVESDGWSDYLPGGSIRLIATTRDRRFAIGTPIPVSSLSPSAARDLACVISGQPASEDESAALERVLAEFAGLPVAVEMSARAVREWIHSWSTYERHLRTQMDQMLEDPEAFGDYRRGVFAALDLSIDRCNSGNHERSVLDALINFAPDAVPLEWTFQTAQLEPDSVSAHKAVAVLAGLGIVTVDDRAKTLSVHRLVHRRAKQRALVEQLHRFAEATEKAMAAVLAWLMNNVDVTQMDLVDARRPHIDAVLQRADDASRDVYWLFIANNLINHLLYRARHEEARAIAERALNKAKRAKPYAPFMESMCLSNVARACKELGELKRATELGRAALKLSRSYFAPLGQHEPIGPYLTRLAEFLHAEGKFEEARQLLKEALAIYEEAYGEEHPRVISTLSSLAMVLRDMGRPAEARPHIERAVGLEEKIGRLHHPDGLVSLTNLAVVLRDLGEITELHDVLVELAAITEAVYGPDHPRVADAVTNVGTILQDHGRDDLAIPYLERALKIRRSSGTLHPGLAVALSSLATALHAIGRLQEARAFLEEAVKVDEAVYEHGHTVAATHLSNLAMLLRDLHKPEEALPLLDRAIDIDRKACHWSAVAVGLSNKANILSDLARDGDAVSLLEEALRYSIQTYGNQHQIVADQMGNLAVVLAKVGQRARARTLLERATVIDEAKVEVTKASSAILRLTSRAQLSHEDRDLKQAAWCLERARAIAESKLGDDHVLVAECISRLASFYCHFCGVAGAQEAIELTREALTITSKTKPEPHALNAELQQIQADALTLVARFGGGGILRDAQEAHSRIQLRQTAAMGSTASKATKKKATKKGTKGKRHRS